MSGEYIVLMRRILRVDRFQLIFRSLLIWSTAPESIPPTSSNHWGILSVLANFDGPMKWILRLSSRQFFRNQFSYNYLPLLKRHGLRVMVKSGRVSISFEICWSCCKACERSLVRLKVFTFFLTYKLLQICRIRSYVEFIWNF